MSTRKGVKRANEKTVDHALSKVSKKDKAKIDKPVSWGKQQPGVVLVMGSGDMGQLGLGRKITERKRPALVAFQDEIVDICCGGMHTVCLTKEGKVLTFGCNDEGALGRETVEEEDDDDDEKDSIPRESIPGEVTLPEKVVQISAGDSHSAVLLESGRVLAWGAFRDSHGSMGLTDNGNKRLPFELLPEETVVKIASGQDHLVMLTNLGKIYTCGCAEQGQLGRIGERFSGRTARCGISRFLVPLPIKARRRLIFEDIWTGIHCTFAKVQDTDDIYVFGLNNYNQIGLSNHGIQFFAIRSPELSKHKWRQMQGGEHHTVLLDDEGKVYTMGRNEYGRLGLGNGCADASEPTLVEALSNKTCVAIGCGLRTSFAVTDSGELYGWGMGSSQLGLEEGTDYWEPELVQGKQLQGRLVQYVSGGGQHLVLLAVPANNNNTNTNTNAK